MGFLSDLGDGVSNTFGEVTGFGSNGNPDPHALNDAAYEDYYTQALNGVQNSGAGTADMRAGIQSGVNDQLAGLANNSAGRKKQFGEDMSRSFGNDVQTKARAAGGTGNLAQAISPTGSMYDSQARQTARGYNDLYSQATKDLGSLTGIQSNLEGQDASRANSAASLNMQRINQRLGIAQGNASAQRDSDAVGAARRTNSINGIVQAGSQAAAGGM